MSDSRTTTRAEGNREHPGPGISTVGGTASPRLPAECQSDRGLPGADPVGACPDQHACQPQDDAARPYSPWILVFLFALSAFLRIASPPDLLKGDQEKQVGYVMDILHGGGLAIQHEVNGKIATKPPLYNWLAAALCRVSGSTSSAAMKLPSLGSAALLLAILYAITRRTFGREAAWWAVAACIGSHHIMKLMWFARTDMLMTCLVYAAILAATGERLPVWRAALAGFLTGLSFLAKGPVGPSLVLVWLAVRHAWARPRPRLRLTVGTVTGSLICLAMAGGWFLLARQDPQFGETVVRGELADRFVLSSSRTKPLWYYVPVLLSRIVPWAFVALSAVWLSRRKSNRMEVLFTGTWFAAFFLFFSLIPAKRHDLLLPAYPPVFMLAGLQMAEFLRSPKARAVGVALLTVWIAAIGLAGWLPNEEQRAYAQLRHLVRPLAEPAKRGNVLIWRSHPLVSYELGLHQRGIREEDLATAASKSPEYLVLGPPLPDSVREAFGGRLVEEARLLHPSHGIDVTVYRVTPTAP